ncbi:alpha/beta-hydrolase [Aureobasidium pullulans]|uniref:Alpha/beta-hydrolase n=1 Tax=Aureobasidium pullulans TaxID=5580 RepID=A0A4S8T0R1_AURPU|nr:alpha/beta-hydrolase [Aureobasidium pullulans]
MPSTSLLVSFLCLFRALLVTSTQDYKEPLDVNEEVPYIRNYFYAGGRYVSDGSGGHVFQDQMYVERLTPPGGPRKQTPLVFIPGAGQTGTNFLNKPDGGRGWASLFIMQGFEVYIVDQTSRGRSAWRPGDGAPGLATSSVEVIQQRFTAPQDYKLWPQAVNHTQWPGTGRMGDPIFDAFYSSNVQYVNNDTYQQATMQTSGADLLDHIGSPAILIGHSQAGPQALLIADARPNLNEAIILLEPGGPPFRGGVFSNASARPWGLADVPLLYSPPVTDPMIDLTTQIMPATSDNLEGCVLQATSPPPKRLFNLAPKPILVVTAEASYHSVYDHCTVSYLRQAGCTRTDHLQLGNAGVHGNGHMLFMEKNSRDVWVLLLEWIEWHLN